MHEEMTEDFAFSKLYKIKFGLSNEDYRFILSYLI